MSGKSVLIARSESQQSSWRYRLNELGAEVICQSAIDIRPIEIQQLHADGENLSEIADLPTGTIALKKLVEVFRSDDPASLPGLGLDCFHISNGVDGLFNSLWKNGLDSRVFGRAKIAGVGPSVRDSLKKWSLHCDLMPGDQLNAESLGKLLVSTLAAKYQDRQQPSWSYG